MFYNTTTGIRLKPEEKLLYRAELHCTRTLRNKDRVAPWDEEKEGKWRGGQREK